MEACQGVGGLGVDPKLAMATYSTSKFRCVQRADVFLVVARESLSGWGVGLLKNQECILGSLQATPILRHAFIRYRV